MKETRKRMISLLALLLVVMFATTACAGGGTAPQDAAPVAIPAGEDGPLVAFPETITITTCKGTSADQEFFDGDNYDDNRWLRLIKEKLNIEVEMLYTADASTDAYRNKMNAQLATGELPDMFYFNDRTFISQALDAGYLADLTDLYETYASDAVKSYRERYPDCFEGNIHDGKLMGFPAIADNFHHGVFLWIRDDWLAASGKEPPKTVDEMVELARIFTEEDPDGNGIDDTYGFGLEQRVYEKTHGSINGLISAFGVPNGGHGFFYRRDDGQVTNGLIEPGVKEALRVTRDMYEKGYIDPEFVARRNEELTADVASGKIGMMYQMNWGTWSPFDTIQESDGIVTHPYPIPTIEGVDFKIGLQNNQISDDGVFMLNANCENPSAFFKIMNLYEETVSESTENFLYYWDHSQAELCPIYIRMPGELYAPILLPALENNDRESLAPAVQTYYDWVKNFEAGTDKSKAAYGSWGQMYERGTMALSLEYVETGHTVTSIMGNERPEIWETNNSIMEQPLQTGFTEIITGTRPLDDFETLVEDWRASGGQQTLDELDQLYPAE